MEITIWGCRGALPIPGRSTVRYGGNTTCLEIRLADGNLIVLDAGTGIRSLSKKIMTEGGRDEIFLLLSHSHWDHLMGFPFFAPGYVESFKIHVRGGPIAKETIRKYLERQMEPPFFPVKFSTMKAEFDFTHGLPQVKNIGKAVITPIPLSHPNGGYGFKIEESGKTFIFMTDNELEYEHEGGRSIREYTRFCEGADLLIHDAQYTMEEYKRNIKWGHSTYKSALDLALNAEVKQFGLFHHDPDHSDADLDRIVAVSREYLAKRNKNMDCFAASEGMSLSL